MHWGIDMTKYIQYFYLMFYNEYFQWDKKLKYIKLLVRISMV